jgi:hypothetical protein
MAKATKDASQADALTVIADAGYSNGSDAAACERDCITSCVSANRSSNNQGDGMLFDRTGNWHNSALSTWNGAESLAATKERLDPETERPRRLQP